MSIEVPQPVPSRPQASPPAVSVSIAAQTDTGRKRQNNEDKCLVLSLDEQRNYDGPMAATFSLGPLGVLLAVADGMGGHQFGEVASALCMMALTREILALVADGRIPAEDSSTLLGETVQTVNEAVYTVAGQKPELNGMGTTLTAAWVTGSQVELAQVGDSRAYRFRQNGLVLLTEDQTVGNLMQAENRGSSLSAQVKDMLTQAVGAQPKVAVALTHSPLARGDCLLLCCDGLYKVVAAEEIIEILDLPVSLQAKAERLVARANENGGPDNISVILAELK